MPRPTRIPFARLVAALLAALLVLGAPLPLAAWDLERIARVKDAAEKAYDAGNYVDAARHYTELTTLLSDALAAGEVPESVAPQAQAALLAATYQLGRANQLSENCEAAAGVYASLVAQSDADAPLRARATARLAEAQVCLARRGIDTANFVAVADALEQADAALNTLGQMLATELVETPDEIPELLAGAHTAIEQTESDATSALASAISGAAEARQCDELERLAAVASRSLPDALPSGTDAPTLLERCRAPSPEDRIVEPEPEPEPEPDEASAGIPWWPALIVMGVGGATLIGAAAYDGVLAGDIDTYDAARARCGIDDLESCTEARGLRGDIESGQDVVVALYVSGGIITAGGLVYTLVAALSGNGDDPTTPQVSLAPTRDGGMLSTWRWRF